MILLLKQDDGRRPMETFATLFGSVLAFVYHCFDRIVILGHIPLLTRPENIVHFFRDLHQSGPITKDVLRKRTNEYNRWVDAFAAKRRIPVEWAEHGVRKEDYVRPHLRRMERQNQFGVYFILKSMEVGPTFRSSADIIRKRLDYWTWLVGPKFSSKDGEAITLSRHYSIQQVEYCRNLIFR